VTPAPALDSASLTHKLKAEAARLGFDAVGIAPAVTPPGYAHFQDWLRKGYQAEMSYLAQRERERSDPSSVLEGVRSVIVVALVYGDRSPASQSETTGKIARYAQGDDYHGVFWRRLEQLLDWLRAQCPDIRGRAVADTAPLLERDYARLAGLGWIAKNTMLINRRLGSFTLLGSLLVDIELEYDAPHERNHCGTCTRCLDACPTDAFAAPYQLDARKCISYWTIEHRGALPDEATDRLHGWAFGCDICQDVCPWNRKAPGGSTSELAPRDNRASANLLEWLTSEPDELRAQIKGTALARAKRTGLLRNAAHVLGERQSPLALPVLIERLLDEPDPIIRAACAWALGKYQSSDARTALELAQNDSDPTVRAAVGRALGLNSGITLQTGETESVHGQAMSADRAPVGSGSKSCQP
jgi:epoxyqueuosine reductase